MPKTAIINNVRYQHKHETQENWGKATNFIPLEGEIIIYDPDNNHKKPRIKIGNGILNPETGIVEGTNVNELPFCVDISNKISAWQPNTKYEVGDIILTTWENADKKETIIAECNEAHTSSSSFSNDSIIHAVWDMQSINARGDEYGRSIYETYATKNELNEVADSIRRWSAGVHYEVGDTVLVKYGSVDKMFKCIIEHTSDEDGDGKISQEELDTNWQEIFQAARAERDSEGNKISSTYLKSTVASNLLLQKTDAANTYVNKKEIKTFLNNFIALQKDFLEIIDSDITGDCTWTLYNTGTLTINGNGAMEDYDSSDGLSGLSPWGTSINKVIIEDGVTSIGKYAFYNCSSLTNITIPNSVTSIDGGAFFNCSSLTSITIPDSVTFIGDSAVYGCDSLKSVYITDIVAWCNIVFLGSFYTSPLFNGADLYLNGELVTDLIIPNGVTTIKSSAFSGCSSLTSITIGDSVTSIGEYAFYNCDNLTTVNYRGSAEDKAKITIEDYNEPFKEATWVYNYEG